MLVTVLKSKVAYAKVTDSNLFYEGSFGIDEEIMKEANILPNEQIHIVNVNNGERLITYAIPAPAGSRQFVLNGPAARKGLIGDEVIIISYVQLTEAEIPLKPILIDLKHEKR